MFASTRLAGNLIIMTTLIRIDGGGGERKSLAVARRLKGALAERGISMSEIARRIGVTQQKLSRRMTGLNSFDIDELDRICAVAGLSFDYIATGIRELPGPGGDHVSGVSSVQSRQEARPHLRLVISNADGQTEAQS